MGRGTVLANPEGYGALVIAPPRRSSRPGHDLVARLDKAEAVRTQSYISWRFGLAETGKIVKDAKSLGIAHVPMVWFEGNECEALAFSIANHRTHEFSM